MKTFSFITLILAAPLLAQTGTQYVGRHQFLSRFARASSALTITNNGRISGALYLGTRTSDTIVTIAEQPLNPDNLCDDTNLPSFKFNVSYRFPDERYIGFTDCKYTGEVSACFYLGNLTQLKFGVMQSNVEGCSRNLRLGYHDPSPEFDSLEREGAYFDQYQHRR